MLPFPDLSLHRVFWPQRQQLGRQAGLVFTQPWTGPRGGFYYGHLGSHKHAGAIVRWHALECFKVERLTILLGSVENCNFNCGEDNRITVTGSSRKLYQKYRNWIWRSRGIARFKCHILFVDTRKCKGNQQSWAKNICY